LFGKPIAQADKADLDRLISDGAEEDRHLEFKEAVSISNEEQRRQIKAGTAKPFDEAVAKGTGIGETGRDALLEELVAFANADGGVIVLGMEETADKPPRAAKITPVPHVITLERRLRDSLNNLIEPRLPFAAVKGIETEADGSGVVLLETQPSTFAPHWVRSTRGAKIRREDRADPLSMPEIHDMVLRNARRLDDVSQQLNDAEAEFEPHFWGVVTKIITPTVAGGSPKEQAEQWAAQRKQYFTGVRVTIVPHQRLGIARLEHIQQLTPDGDIHFLDDSKEQKHPLNNPAHTQPRRLLGGIEIQSESPAAPRSLLHNLRRDGVVEVKSVRTDNATIGLHIARVLASVGSAVGFYHKLREKAGTPNMPAEVGIEILAVGAPRPMVGWGITEILGSSLEFRTLFPWTTIAERENFDDYLNDVAGDLWNAANGVASQLPRFSLQFT
jgi:hypothetical protein